MRDTDGGFGNGAALRAARIEMTAVISPIEPQVVPLYGRIYDDPKNPFGLEALGMPFYTRGHPERTKYEYLCLRDDLDFAVIGPRDEILANRRITMSRRMRGVLAQLRGQLRESPGRDLSDSELGALLRAHVAEFSPDTVQY